jgi:hypothetical protein
MKHRFKVHLSKKGLSRTAPRFLKKKLKKEFATA